MKTIGLLTAGGDAPGMNACIATIAIRAEEMRVPVRGIFRGFSGLMEGNSVPIGTELAGFARRGGTFLGTSRSGYLGDELLEDEIEGAMQSCNVDALIIIGGGGPLGAAARLANNGYPVIGIPSTINNDIYGTEFSLGFHSALNKSVQAANDIMDTAESLGERIFLIETLGGVTGHIAVATAYAAFADAVFIHERKLSVTEVGLKIKNKLAAGGSHGLVVLCEGLGTTDIAQEISALTGKRTRITDLGMIMRGGSPAYFDRELAREFGEAALDMILADEFGQMVTYSCGAINSISLQEVAGKSREIDQRKYDAVNRVVESKAAAAPQMDLG